MKIRCGFVSNSSSSSFAVFGIKLTHSQFLESQGLKEEDDFYEKKEYQEVMKKLQEYFKDDIIIVDSFTHYYIGYGSRTSSEYSYLLPDKEFVPVDVDKLKKKLAKFNLKSKEFGLFIGTYHC